MDTSSFETKLKGFLDEISNLPAMQSRRPLVFATKKETRAAVTKSDTLEDSLEHLELIVKYLIFDVEATKRENQCLREALESGDD